MKTLKYFKAFPCMCESPDDTFVISETEYTDDDIVLWFKTSAFYAQPTLFQRVVDVFKGFMLMKLAYETDKKEYADEINAKFPFLNFKEVDGIYMSEYIFRYNMNLKDAIKHIFSEFNYKSIIYTEIFNDVHIVMNEI